MGQATIILEKEEIEKMKTYYYNYLEKSPQGAIFRARTDNAVITAYRSGKILFQGNNIDTEINKWKKGLGIPKKTSTTKRKTANTSSYIPPSSVLTGNQIGSDESGTGDYFGPVTTAAVYITKDQITLLKELGIQDSKAINDEVVQKLAKDIAMMNIPYSLMILHNDKYNSLQQRGWSQGKMKAMLHHSTINQLIKKIDNAPYEGIVIDQFCQPSVYINYLKSEQKYLNDKTYFMTKAENHAIAVAAGSVIARASFLQEMRRLSHEIGIDLLKGASTKVDQLIARIIKEKGHTTLERIAKLHFKNTEKAEKYL